MILKKGDRGYDIKNLCRFLCSKYTINKIKGHKELGDTDCPGINYPLSIIKNSI